MKRGSLELQRWQQSFGTRLVNTDITLRWRRCNTMCCNSLFCFIFMFVYSKLLYLTFSFFQQCPCLIWFAERACKQLSQRGKMIHLYPIDMPFLTHLSEKSPPSCIKFRACSKSCNFSRTEIALKLQVVYTRGLKLQSGCNRDCTENRDKNCIKNC